MRPLIYYAATSLDGFIAGPNDEIDWLFTDGDYGFKEFFDSIDTIISGRKTWDISKTFEEIPFKDKDIVIFSRSGTELRERSPNGLHSLRSLGEDPIQLTRVLLASAGGSVWLLGGGDIAGQLANAGLDKRVKLELLKSEPFPSGLLQITYKVIAEG